MISIIATPLFLIAQSKIRHPFFPESQLVIVTNRKIYKRVWALFFHLQVSRINQPVLVCIGQPTDWEHCAHYWVRSEYVLTFALRGDRVAPQHTSEQRSSSCLYYFFEMRRDKRRWFIHCLVYNMVYPSISSNLVTLTTLTPQYDSVCTHICYPSSRKPS